MNKIISLCCLFALLCLAGAAHAFDLSGTFYDNATDGEVVDLSAHYAQGPVDNLQLTLWTDSETDVSANNATISCAANGADGYESVQVEFLDGSASATTVTDVDNASDPVVVRFSGWACESVKITPADADGADYTYSYVLTGWRTGR